MAVDNTAFFIGEFMTVQVTDRLSQLYVGNGANKRFDFIFRVFDQEDETGVAVRVKVGNDFEFLDESKYTVTVNQDNLGGYVTFNEAPSNQTYFYIAGKTPVDQLLDITNYDNFYPDALERALDKITAILQEWNHLVDFETQARILADIAYDDLAKEREADLKAYIDGIASAITGRPVLGLPSEFVVDGNDTQKQINDKSVRVFETISDLLAYVPRKDKQVVYVKGYHAPTNFALAQPYKGGGHRTFVESRRNENDGFLCINGWVLQHENVFTPYHSGCKCDGVTDDTLNFDKLMYALERNNLKGHVIINDPMFFNSQCPRIGKLIDPVQFNEKNAIRLVSNVKLEINSTLTFGSFYSGSSGQPKCNILSAMYRADVDDWYGKNRHENIKVFGTGTLDFTATESESAVQDGYRWIIKASVKGMKVHGLKFIGGDFANAIQTSKTSQKVEIYDNTFTNLMSNKSQLHDHSTIYCIGKDIKVHDNVFEFTNVKGRLNACACELHGSEQWFYDNKVFSYPNLVFSAILRTDQSLDENEVVYDQKVFGNTANISRSGLGYWSILGKTAKLNDLTFNDNTLNFIEPPTLSEFNDANVNGMSYPSSLPASIFTVWHEGDSVPNITYAAEVLQGIYIHDNIQTAVDGLLQSQDVSLIRFVGCYSRENLKIFNNSFKLNRLLNRDVSTSTTSDYFSGWYIKNNTYDFSKHKSVIYSFTMYLEYMKNCVFDFALDSNFPVIDKTYNFLYFVFADRSKVKDNVIKIDVEKSYDALDAWFGGSMMTYTRAEMRLQNNSIESTSYCYIKESRVATTTVATMQIVTNNIPLSVQSGFIKRYMDEMIGSIYYPSSYTLDYSVGSKLKAVATSASVFPESTESDRNAYIKFIC